MHIVHIGAIIVLTLVVLSAHRLWTGMKVIEQQQEH